MQFNKPRHIIPTSGALSGTREICNHFCRTGRCKHGADCRYVHDREKVSLCRAFLQGECSKSSDECALSHDRDPARTPECGLFLRNLCIDPACRYLHVKKASDAAVCELFFTSWCPAGISCPKRHYLPPSAPDKKRGREDNVSDKDQDSDEEDEDSRLRRIWDQEPSLKIYM